jgi:hypothetical protein
MLTILHLSIIVAFISSIIDLSQILQRGRFNTDHGLGLESVQSLIMAREVGYAISNSLRFLFFWLFVAEPPKAERGAPNARAGGHSGSWNAWGYIGLTLRWSTLALILVVFVLQVVWRLDSKVQMAITNLYTAESAIRSHSFYRFRPQAPPQLCPTVRSSVNGFARSIIWVSFVSLLLRIGLAIG